MAIGTNQYDALKARAYKLVKEAKLRGEILPATNFKCSDCPKQAECYDHRDYTKPLQVDPVCRSCNLRRGPAINAPADILANEHKFIRRTEGIKTIRGSLSPDYIDIADFPGHCMIDVDDNLIECYEITARSERDPDVVSYMDEIIKAHKAQIQNKKAAQKNLAENGLTNKYQRVVTYGN